MGQLLFWHPLYNVPAQNKNYTVIYTYNTAVNTETFILAGLAIK